MRDYNNSSKECIRSMWKNTEILTIWNKNYKDITRLNSKNLTELKNNFRRYKKKLRIKRWKILKEFNSLMMDYWSLSTLPEVIQGKYLEEVESVTNRREKEMKKTVKAKNKKERRNSQDRTLKMKMTMMIAISDTVNVHLDYI